MAPAPRTIMVVMARAVRWWSGQLKISKRWGSRVWLIIRTVPPSSQTER